MFLVVVFFVYKRFKQRELKIKNLNKNLKKETIFRIENQDLSNLDENDLKLVDELAIDLSNRDYVINLILNKKTQQELYKFRDLIDSDLNCKANSKTTFNNAENNNLALNENQICKFNENNLLLHKYLKQYSANQLNLQQQQQQNNLISSSNQKYFTYCSSQKMRNRRSFQKIGIFYL